MKKYRISIVIEKDEDGYYAFTPELQGCYAQGDSYEKVLENIRDVYKPKYRRSIKIRWIWFGYLMEVYILCS